MQAPGPATARSGFGSEAASDALAVARSAPLLLQAHKELDAALRERLSVAVSQVNACSGCTRVHQRWALAAEVTRAELTALGIGDLAALDPASRVAVVYAS